MSATQYMKAKTLLLHPLITNLAELSAAVRRRHIHALQNKLRVLRCGTSNAGAWTVDLLYRCMKKENAI